jgi:hypothetical protein
VSNAIFSDPAHGKRKTLRFAYELVEGSQFYFHEINEGEFLFLPRYGGNRVGLFYTNNDIQQKYLDRVLGQLKKAANGLDILTCPWHPIEDNPFPEFVWNFHTGGYLNIALQVLKLLYIAEELGGYEYVFFLEHDVLYPEGYFDIEPFETDVLSSTNFMGLSSRGFQLDHGSLEPLHQLAMRLPVAINHFESRVRLGLLDRNTQNEPFGRSWKRRETEHPTVHIFHGKHLAGHFYSNKRLVDTHSYWGSASSWFD